MTLAPEKPTVDQSVDDLPPDWSKPTSRDSAGWVARHGGGLKYAVGTALFVGSILVFWRVWQILFAWQYGLDASTPEFAAYWLSLLAANLTGITVFGGAFVLYLARGCKVCAQQRAEYGDVLPRHEADHIWRLWSITAGFTTAFFAFSFFAEQDAAWHQVTVRDTAFTPSHISLFFGAAPVAVVFAAAIYVYAATRVPKVYGKGVPLSLASFMAGVFLLFVWVGFNEWGHSFWIAEELFSAPLHWGFVIMAFVAFTLLGMFTQTIGRMRELTALDAAASDDGGAHRVETTG